MPSGQVDVDGADRALAAAQDQVAAVQEVGPGRDGVLLRDPVLLR